MNAMTPTRNFYSRSDMDRDLDGKTILIVEGSLLAGAELADAFRRAGANVQLTTNLINAFNLLRREPFDGAVVDQGRHNEAFDLCSELRDLGIPYIGCVAPHRLQRAAMRARDAEHIVGQLQNKIFEQFETPPLVDSDRRHRRERRDFLMRDCSDERTASR